MPTTIDDDDAGVDDPLLYPVRVMVGGPRNANPPEEWFEFHMRQLLKNWPVEDVLIIDGWAKGIDAMANAFAKKHGYAYKRYLPEWDKFHREGKKNPAGMIRNVTMLKVCTHYAAFWDGVSPGTGGAIREAKKLGVNYRVTKLPRR